jgi:preprotein translocase subunit SecF
VAKTQQIENALAKKFDITPSSITDSQVSSSWGGQVTDKALVALVVFLVLVAAYLAIRFEARMAVAALLALLHDLLLTAGVYSLVGFEVTPSTIVGLLTILGFSLYDTVVVFDKVAEDTRGILGGSRIDYAGAANNAVNETLMRSINTSLISLLPVGGLLFVGAGLLGVGTLKDLALVQLVGILVGTYSSIFLATPLLVTLRERTELVRTHTRRVRRRRKGSEETSEAATSDEKDRSETAEGPETAREPVTAAASKPAPGARPIRPSTRSGRPTGKRTTRRR